MRVCWGLAPLDALVLVEKMGLAPLGTTGTQIPLCIGATGGPPTPALPAKAVPMMVWGANTLSWYAWSSATKSLPLMPFPEGNEP